MSENTRVLIAGGGIGGLALAIALRRKNMHPVVVERTPEFTDVGAGLVLSPNGMKALAALGEELAEDVCAAGAPIGTDQTSYFLTASGRILARMTLGGGESTWGASTVPILRSRLQEVLLRHAAKHQVEIRTGDEVIGHTDTGTAVTLHLADGSTVTGDLLAGADGAHSVVRRGLLDDGDARYVGYTAVAGTAPAPEPFPNGFIAYGRGLILFAATLGEQRVYWVATISSPPDTWPRKDDQTAQQDLLTRLRAQRWHPALIAMVEATDRAGFVRTDITDRDPVSSWHRGRVVLLGDAAHPIVPTMGQGANIAFEDAVVLTHHLSRDQPLDAALAAYVAERAPRTAKIVKQSRMMGVIGHARNPLAAWTRNRMMTLMSRFGNPDKQNAALFGWQPPTIGTGARQAS